MKNLSGLLLCALILTACSGDKERDLQQKEDLLNQKEQSILAEKKIELEEREARLTKLEEQKNGSSDAKSVSKPTSPPESDEVRDGRVSHKRVKFQRGRTTAILTGTLRDGDVTVYTLGAGAGQTMTAHSSTTDRSKKALFSVSGPDGEFGEHGLDPTSDWSEVLPSKGDYQITVVGGEGKTDYTLEVGIR